MTGGETVRSIIVVYCDGHARYSHFATSDGDTDQSSFVLVAVAVSASCQASARTVYVLI